MLCTHAPAGWAPAAVAAPRWQAGLAAAPPAGGRPWTARAAARAHPQPRDHALRAPPPPPTCPRCVNDHFGRSSIVTPHMACVKLTSIGRLLRCLCLGRFALRLCYEGCRAPGVHALQPPLPLPWRPAAARATSPASLSASRAPPHRPRPPAWEGRNRQPSSQNTTHCSKQHLIIAYFKVTRVFGMKST